MDITNYIIPLFVYTFKNKKIIKMMNPMYYIEDSSADKAQFWRIWHGECDRDTSLAVSAILNIKLTQNNFDVCSVSPPLLTLN